MRHDDAARPFVIAVDGHSAAGKSTFARQLADSIGDDTTIIAMDDFYRVMDPDERLGLTPREGVDRYFDWERLIDEVLMRLEIGAHLRCAPYDWIEGRLGPERAIVIGRVVIVEGVYSARPELRPFVDRHVLVDTPADKRHARQTARGESSLEWRTRWEAAEDVYFAEVYADDADERIAG